MGYVTNDFPQLATITFTDDMHQENSVKYVMANHKSVYHMSKIHLNLT